MIILLLILAISLAVFALFVAIATIIVKKIWLSGSGYRKYNNYRTYEYKATPMVNRQKVTYSTNSTTTEPKDGDISPTGWVYNGKTKLWERPKDE